MEVIVFNGSHKQQAGNTSLLVSAFLKGVRQAGGKGEEVHLAKYQIGFCRTCQNCWFVTPGHCSLDDDMKDFLERIRAADIVGFALPVYVDNVSGLMKVFMDRLMPLGAPGWDTDQHGETRHKSAGPGKLMVFLSNAGYPEQSHFAVLRLLARRMSRNLQWPLAGEIYRGGGGLLSRHRPEDAKHIDAYLDMVTLAGHEIVSSGSVAPETRANLERNLLPSADFADTFRTKVNELVEHRLAKLEA